MPADEPEVLPAGGKNNVMRTDESAAVLPADRAASPSMQHGAPAMSLDLLVAEADRQLTICNACRYCEGLCAVFPALERRSVFDAGDVSQLANLCHDCRACFDACMYAPPHEFGVNLPRVLAAVRDQDYRRYVWPHQVPRLLRGWAGAAVGIPVVALVLAGIALALNGLAGLVAVPHGAASPYALLPYPVLLAIVGVPALFAVAVMAAAVRAYWAATASSTATTGHAGGMGKAGHAIALWRAVLDALTLRYLRGGGIGCPYPRDDTPSPARRRLHALVAGGFALCLLSTVSAAILQDLLGVPPPYPLLSVPVTAGTIGGIGIAVGCTGLLWMKPTASRITSDAPMTARDYALLTCLDFLALSGIATLVTRATPAFGIVFLVHLVAIGFTFAAAPYSKFPHFIYRYLALVRDNLEAEPR
jgi:citrate/tricarballylate utilization protein